MPPNRDTNGTVLLGHVLLPATHEDDARQTAEALAPYDPDRVTGLSVLEQRQGPGHPDPAPVEERESRAAEVLDAVQNVFPDAGRRTVSSRNAPGAIFEAADELAVDAIVYRTSEKGRLMTALSDDLSLELVTRADRPVITLPPKGEEE